MNCYLIFSVDLEGSSNLLHVILDEPLAHSMFKNYKELQKTNFREDGIVYLYKEMPITGVFSHV